MARVAWPITWPYFRIDSPAAIALSAILWPVGMGFFAVMPKSGRAVPGLSEILTTATLSAVCNRISGGCVIAVGDGIVSNVLPKLSTQYFTPDESRLFSALLEPY